MAHAARPRIGITVGNLNPQVRADTYSLGAAYARAVVRAGGLPLILTQEPGLAEAYLDACDAFVLTGGNDPATEPFGQPTHAQARRIDPARQRFETELLAALEHRPDVPVLGICLGCQMLALHAGGRLDQHLPETLGDEAAATHQGNRLHPVELHDWPLDGLQAVGFGDTGGDGGGGGVVSSHHQAVVDPGRLRVVANAPDGVIEAVHDPGRPFYLGVQWHPERACADTSAPRLTRDLFEALVLAAAAASGARAGRS
ncbi:MAG: gamma-glutamyl-gamma-aminobutyrate hydrolase family protein [Phycisphaeraceae bacterium]